MDEFRTVMDLDGRLHKLPMDATPAQIAAVRKSSQEVKQVTESPQTVLSEHDQTKLDGMTKPELKALLHRLLCQYGQIPMMTEEETAQAILDRLAASAISGKTGDWLPAAREWFDRMKGKPKQAVDTRFMGSLQISWPLPKTALDV